MPKILLVEDDNNLREIYEARLQAEGYTIVSARDGEEALVVAKAEKPDLIISDIMMPKISGFEMLDILRNTDGLKDVKVIMLTALGQSDDQKRADKLGADRYLVKSQVTLEDIVKATQELLNAGPTPMPAGATDSPNTVPSQGQTPAAATEPAAQATTGTPVPSEADAFKQAPEESKASPAAEATEDAHDKVMEDAVETLVANTEEKADSSETVTPEPDVKPDETKAAGTTDETDDDTSPKHKKVISPIDSEPKKDIHALLAEEEAKESAASIPADNPAVTEAKEEQAAAESENVASTTADEEATVEAKIEDFVAGATTEPSTPADNPAETAKQAETPAAGAPAKEKKITVTTDSKPNGPSATAGPKPAPLDDTKSPAGPEGIAL